MSKHNTTAPADIRKAIEPDQSLFKFSLLSLMGTCLGIALAATLLYVQVINGSNRQMAATVIESHAASYARQVDQAIGQLQSQLEHISQSPALVSAITGASSQQLAQQQQALQPLLPYLRDLRLIPLGERVLSRSETQLSFPEIDMINRASQGQAVPAEAHLIDQQRVIRLASPVNTGNKIGGVILATFDLGALREPLVRLNSQGAGVRLEQTLASQPPQPFLDIGQRWDSSRPETTQALDNPRWRLRFQPPAELTGASTLPATTFWVPVGLALALTILSILFAYTRLRNSVRSDAIELVNYCRNLIQGEAGREPDFRLSLFHSMAHTLAETDREPTLSTSQPQNTPVATEPATPAAADAMQISDSLHNEIDDDSLLDFDLLKPEAAATSEAETDAPDQTSPAAPLLNDVPAEIFRAYDIRGIVGDTLDTDIAYRIGQAVGSQAAAEGETSVIVGADGRLSSPELSAALIQGLRDTGQHVINLGTVPTPLVYFATHCMESGSGVMITGSHNPSDYNGFKIVINGHTLANDDIQVLYRRICHSDFVSGQGELDNLDIIAPYIDHILSDVALARPLTVVLDCGNGVAAEVAPKLLESLGCNVVPLFCEIDGTFPNHHPDPGKPENLQDLIRAVAEHEADIGIALDGDGDRLGVVTNRGTIIWPDRLMMLFAKDVAARNPGADIIYDVKCSRRLASLISSYGGRPIMWKTGHSLIKSKMAETGALLAGEMSGHIFFKERWFGFDDGLYSAVRLLEILAGESCDAETLFEAFPDDPSTPEINIQVTEDSKFKLVEQLRRQGAFEDADVSTIDGIRADFAHGWGLVRASNTTPVLVLRFGAEDDAALAAIQAHFKRELLNISPELEIPF